MKTITPYRSRSIFACLVLSAIAAIGLSPGCATTQDVQTSRDAVAAQKAAIDAAAAKTDAAIERMHASIDAVDAEKQRLATVAAGLGPGTHEKGIADAQLQVVADRLDKLEAGIATVIAANDAAKQQSQSLDQKIKASDGIVASVAPDQPNPGAVIGSVIGALAPGAAAFAPLLLGALYKGVRLQQAKDKLKDESDAKTDAIGRIVASIDALAAIAPEVGAAISKHAGILDTIQTPIGKIAVDQAKAGNTKPVSLAA